MLDEVPLRGAKRLGEAMVERRRRIDMRGEERGFMREMFAVR